MKKKADLIDKSTGIRLKDSVYWRWRLTIEEMEHAATKVNQIASLQKIEGLNSVISQMSVKIIGNKLAEAKQQFNQAKIEYNNYKAEIEKVIGRSLNNCSIDEYTYEVIELPSETKKEG